VSARYTVGIDLGTSNTVVAYAALDGSDAGGSASIQLLLIPQLVGPGEVAAQALLPSVRYHPATDELQATDLQLRWPATDVGAFTAVIGRYARELGMQVPGRLVASAKSWLSHPGVDRTAAILPWGAPDDVPKVSPVEASASYLAHVHAAWNAQFPDAPLAAQDLVLTVPASFDEGARALTVEAAHLAGLPGVRLLEEPQAAFHDWLFRHRNSLSTALAQTRLVLVCDVGGGTTDLTLIQVAHTGAAMPQLTRIGVGDHLMLGGDNMDLALAHLVEQRLGDTTPLSAARLAQLVQRCRVAKEILLAADAPQSTTVTLLGAGARLIGAARSVELTRDEVTHLLVDGFMPQGGAHSRPLKRRAGLVEFGLPYPADPAITRHLAAFLARHDSAARQALINDPLAGALAMPDTLLLNGGAFHAPALAQRLERTLALWRGGPLQVLHNEQPDVAVARGAVAYALVRAARVPQLGSGIGGGSARSYFLVLEGAGAGAQGRGICVLPRGTQTGAEVHLHSHTFALRVGEAVRFHLVSSVADTPWQAGELVDINPDTFVRLPTMTSVLPAPQGQRRAQVNVQLMASMTEVGTLEMHCVRTGEAAQRWLLAFQLRGQGAEPDQGSGPGLAAPYPRLADALTAIDRVFGSASIALEAREVRQLRGTLERLLGRRDTWDLALLRALFDALLAGARRRRRSAEHERVWLNLAGYCLRPGLGAPLDAWRIAQIWPLFAQGLQYVGESSNWSEWWTLWRRAAGGLSEAQQLVVLEVLVGHLEAMETRRAKDPVQGSYDDMVRLAAALEGVPPMHRIDVGHWLLDRLQRSVDKPQAWWAVGRIGARVSLYGSAHQVVAPEVAVTWLNAILALDWRQVEPAAFAAAQIARLSGDRARDLAPELRSEVARRLTAAKAPPSWSRMVMEVVQLDETDQKRSFGEGLPPGLQLIAV
jgi:molecular chaperone DnaK (HSP70)